MESAGERLKKIRQELGISLEEVQKKTKIHLNILKSIEGDGLTDLSPVYLKGFLKIYCKFLGVDPAEYIPDYRESQTQFQTQMKAEGVLGKPKSFFKTASRKILSFRPHVLVKIVSIYVLAFIFLSLVLFNLGKAISSRRKSSLIQGKPTVTVTPSLTAKPTLAKKESGKQEQKAQNVKTLTATATPKPTTQEAKRKKESASGIRLGIRAKENCWVSLKVDGHVVFHRILEKGRFETWVAKEKMELSLGNASAVELEVNGQVFSNLGRKGQALKNISITKEGLNLR